MSQKRKWKRGFLAERPGPIKNILEQNHYIDFLLNAAVSRFNWSNMPPEIDVRFLEMCLANQGFVLFFYDDVAAQYVCIKAMIAQPVTVYDVPIFREAYASNGYHLERDFDNSVIIFNNHLRQPTYPAIVYYAEKIADVERTIQVNLKHAKHPFLLTCEESQRLTLANVYRQLDDNEEAIFGNKSAFKEDSIKAIDTKAPYLCKDLFNLKAQYINEAMQYLGIKNSNTEKAERLLSTEVNYNMGLTNSMMLSALHMRQQACKQINNMFGLNISVEFNHELIQEPEVSITEYGQIYDGTTEPSGNESGLGTQAISDI